VPGAPRKDESKQEQNPSVSRQPFGNLRAQARAPAFAEASAGLAVAPLEPCSSGAEADGNGQGGY